MARNIHEIEAESKSDKEFFALVDAEFQIAMQALGSSGGPVTQLPNEAE